MTIQHMISISRKVERCSLYQLTVGNDFPTENTIKQWHCVSLQQFKTGTVSVYSSLRLTLNKSKQLLLPLAYIEEPKADFMPPSVS